MENNLPILVRYIYNSKDKLNLIYIKCKLELKDIDYRTLKTFRLF